jgi:serine/threonine-protein kinase
MFTFFSRVVEGMPEAPSARAARTHGVMLGDAFDRWLARGTAGAPGDRFASASVAVAELASALGVAPPPGIAQETLVSAGVEGWVADTRTLATEVDLAPPTVEPTLLGSEEPFSLLAAGREDAGPRAAASRRSTFGSLLGALAAFGVAGAIAWNVVGPSAGAPAGSGAAGSWSARAETMNPGAPASARTDAPAAMSAATADVETGRGKKPSGSKLATRRSDPDAPSRQRWAAR